MTTHEHGWLRQPQHSGRFFERFRCECGAWAYRHLKNSPRGRASNEIVAYVDGWTPPPPEPTARPLAGRERREREAEEARRQS